MSFKVPIAMRRFLKATKFGQDNYLILRELKYFKKTVALAVFFTLLAAVFEGFGVGFLLSFLQSLTQPDAAAVKTGINWLDVWVLGADLPANERIYRISGFILLTTLIRTSFFYLGRVYAGYAQANLTYQLQMRIFEQVQALSQKFFTKTRSGALVNTMTTEITQLKQALDIMSVILIRFSILVTYLISMFALSWQLSSISIMLFVLLTVGISSLLKQVREISFDVTRANSWYTSIALEFMNGIKTVQASVAQDFERQRIHNASDKLRSKERQSAVYRVSIEPISEAVSTIILVSMLLFAFAFLIPAGKLTVASLLTFLFILFRLIPLVRILNNSRSRLSNFQGSISNIQELLRTDNKPYITNGAKPFSRLQQGIEFNSVDFGYEPNKLVLRDITLNIEKGKMTALVGGSGAGKTTLADLIPRFYDATSGQITLDGTDLREFEIDSLRRRMAIVSQDTFVFNTTVKENIAYGLSNIRDEDIFQAAKLANAWEFIQDLPEGFDSELGDRGTRLSGGQRQRIAIARALLRNPDILILDEATSALDSVSEKLIQESLEKLAEGRTVIAIAHRLSTIAKADKVVVLEQGKIIEQGSYQDLLSTKGKLWKYHQIQYQTSTAK